ncbi:MAG: glycosyltransferase [Acidobacteriota bacterium]
MAEIQKKILVIDSRPPTPDYDSGSMRMSRLLDALLSLSCKVTFAASFPLAWPPLSERAETDILNLKNRGIEVAESVDGHLLSEGRRYDAVILSGGVYTAIRHVESVFKHAPQADLIFDTVDLHFLREYRHARLTANQQMLRRALASKANEVAIARRARWTLVVSPAEKDILSRECPEARVEVLSNIHETRASREPFTRRRDILFIGAFQHLPNRDAVSHFVEEIFPLVKKEIPDLRFFILGGHPPAEIQRLDSEDIIVTGHLSDIDTYLDSCKLSVAPLRFGAGVKGKVLLSLSRGLPVVATSIAAEGMYLTNGKDVMVADSASEFGRAIVDLYNDEDRWSEISTNGLEIVSRYFSFAAARETMKRLLGI